MGPRELFDAMGVAWDSRQPCMVRGKPGVGKTTIARQLAESRKSNYMDIRVNLREPSDFKFPIVDVGKMMVSWVQSVFPNDPRWHGVIALEELDKAPPLVANALLGLIHERRLGTDYQLPDGAYIVATVNRAEDRAGSHRFGTAMLNRFIHLELDASLDDWKPWAFQNQIDTRIISYLTMRPANLSHFDPASNAYAFPSPRSWHMLSDVLKQAPPALHRVFAIGTVGEGAGCEFLAHVKIVDGLPNIDEILSDPETAKVPKEPSVLYAMAGALADRARSAKEAQLSNIMTYATRLPKEFSVLVGKDCAHANAKILDTKGAKPWLADNRHVILSR